MQRNFKIREGIYLVHGKNELDLHNNFDFLGLDYSVENRTLLLRWQRSPSEWVPSGTPSAVTIEFREVSEFRFQPRDAAKPFTEDDCLSSFGYWTDEAWADGVMIVDSDPTSVPPLLTALDFMSGAMIAVQAASAQARIEA